MWSCLLKHLKIDILSPLEKNEHRTRPGSEARKTENIDRAGLDCSPARFKTCDWSGVLCAVGYSRDTCVLNREIVTWYVFFWYYKFSYLAVRFT